MEYISKQSLLADLNEATPRSYFAFETMVREYPTEDVAPVIHAHWEYVKSTDHEWDYPWMCSECGSCSQWETDYCKDCGAKMDEEEGQR